MFATIPRGDGIKLTRSWLLSITFVKSLIYFENYSIVLTTHFTATQHYRAPTPPWPAHERGAGALLPAIHGVRHRGWAASQMP